MAWKRGIVVVASVGNQGDSYPGLNSPSYNPWVLAVGAVDTKGTTAVSDDVVPSFSAIQGGNFGSRGPDLVAPGKGIVSLNVPGSTISSAFPAARVASGFLRGSGTSQAAAVGSGAVALLLQPRPTLAPNQVKALLMGSARPPSGIASGVQGAGELNLTAAAARRPLRAEPGLGNGTGSLSRLAGQVGPVDGWNLCGELDIFNGQWRGAAAGPNGSASMWSADGSTWRHRDDWCRVRCRHHLLGRQVLVREDLDREDLDREDLDREVLEWGVLDREDLDRNRLVVGVLVDPAWGQQRLG